MKACINRGIIKNKWGDKNGSDVDFAKAIELNPSARGIFESKGYSIGK